MSHSGCWSPAARYERWNRWKPLEMRIRGGAATMGGDTNIDGQMISFGLAIG